MGKRIYPIELRDKVLDDYKAKVGGYKLLAKKYELSRDTVRGWVLMDRAKRAKIQAKEAQKSEEKTE